MRPSKSWVGLLLGVLMALTIPFAAVSAASPNRSDSTGTSTIQATNATNTFSSIPVTGSTLNGGSFNGLLDISKFKVVNGVLTAVGNLTGTLTNSSGGTIGSVDQKVKLPVNVGGASTCDILHLKLGPLDLNLLGLQVHLNRIKLDITASAAPGNLLGNLLCAVAHLLDSGLGGSSLSSILNNLLNAILGVLNL